MNKYKNIKIEFNGIMFDSKDEADFYKYLLESYDKDKIIIQPAFILQNAFINEYSKTKMKPIIYIADFQIDNIVYDIKGFSTPVALLKKKMFIFKYPNLKLIWLARNPKKFGGGFIEVEKLKKLRKAKNGK